MKIDRRELEDFVGKTVFYEGTIVNNEYFLDVKNRYGVLHKDVTVYRFFRKSGELVQKKAIEIDHLFIDCKILDSEEYEIITIGTYQRSDGTLSYCLELVETTKELYEDKIAQLNLLEFWEQETKEREKAEAKARKKIRAKVKKELQTIKARIRKAEVLFTELELHIQRLENQMPNLQINRRERPKCISNRYIEFTTEELDIIEKCNYNLPEIVEECYKIGNSLYERLGLPIDNTSSRIHYSAPGQLIGYLSVQYQFALKAYETKAEELRKEQLNNEEYFFQRRINWLHNNS